MTEELTVKGVAMRAITQRYGAQTAMKSRASLLHALRYTPTVPITLNHAAQTHVSHDEEDRQIGVFTASHVDASGRLHGSYTFWLPETPPPIQAKIRSRQRVPTSVGFDYVQGPGGPGYDYSQDRIRLGHVAVYPEEGPGFMPRCSLAQGCGVGYDATGPDETRLICHDAVVVGEGDLSMPDTPQPTSHSEADPSVGKPTESAAPPLPPVKGGKDTQQPPAPCEPGAKDHSDSLSALDALRGACADLDPSLKDVVSTIDSPAALRGLLKRAKDALTAADAALPMGQPDPRGADPHNLGQLRKDQIQGLKDNYASRYQYTRDRFTGGS